MWSAPGSWEANWKRWRKGSSHGNPWLPALGTGTRVGLEHHEQDEPRVPLWVPSLAGMDMTLSSLSGCAGIEPCDLESRG